MTHDEIVMALRWLAKETEFTFAAENLNGAADLIESLQAQLSKLEKKIAAEGFSGLKTMISKYKTVMLAANEISIKTDEELEELRAQIDASQRREQAAVEDLNGTGACFTCKHFCRNGGDCFGAGRCRLDGIEIWPCNKPGVYRVEVPDDGRKTYEWRGPQEAGEGEAE